MKNNKLVFIITSCINFIDKPLSYSPIRSQYTPKERLKQTYKTINSIRLKCPNARIILLELGRNGELLSEFKNKVDSYLYLGNNFLVTLAIESKWKGLGEAVSLILANKYIVNKGDFYIKISGRYYLNDNFNLSSWNPKKFNFLYRDGVYSTRLYGFPFHYLNYWYYSLLKSIPQLMLGRSIEHILKKIIDKSRINYMKKLGVEGKIGIDGNYIIE